MEKYQSLYSRVGILHFFLGIFLLFRIANAENKTYPTANNKLDPIEQWRSAFYCLQNVSAVCAPQYTLNMSGWLNVTHDYGPKFCEANGCAEHTRAVLTCLHDVKNDFWFANKASIKNLNDTINVGCDTSQGFNGTSFYSSSYKVKSAPISVLSVVLLLALLHI